MNDYSNEKEIWKHVVGINGPYFISNFGHLATVKVYGQYTRNGVRTLKKNIRMKKLHLFWSTNKKVGKKGYLSHTLYNGGSNKGINKRVHRMVAEAFIPNPNNFPVVNHIDGDKSNNNVSNLEWTTFSKNNRHALDNGLRHSNKNNRHMSKGVSAYNLDGSLFKSFPSMREAERQLNLSNGVVSKAIQKGWNFGGFIWKINN